MDMARYDHLPIYKKAFELTKYFDKHQDTKAVYIYIEGNLEKWLVHHVETMDKMMAQFYHICS